MDVIGRDLERSARGLSSAFRLAAAVEIAREEVPRPWPERIDLDDLARDRDGLGKMPQDGEQVTFAQQDVCAASVQRESALEVGSRTGPIPRDTRPHPAARRPAV